MIICDIVTFVLGGLVVTSSHLVHIDLWFDLSKWSTLLANEQQAYALQSPLAQACAIDTHRM